MDLRLVIVRVALCKGFHRLRIGHDAAMMIQFVVILIHHCQRIDIGSLAFRLKADCSCFLDCRRPLRENSSPAAQHADSTTG